MSGERKWYYAYQVDDWPQQLDPEEAVSYTGPFETENEALKALIVEMQQHIERLEGDEAGFEDGDLSFLHIKPHAVVKTAIKLGVKKPPPIVIWDEDEDD